MFKNFDEMCEQEVEQAINKGYEKESAWLKRCDPNLINFALKDWKECISEKENPHYQNCRQMILERLKDNRLFLKLFLKVLILILIGIKQAIKMASNNRCKAFMLKFLL